MKCRGSWSALALLAFAASAQTAAARPQDQPVAAAVAQTESPFAAATPVQPADLAKVTGRDDTSLLIRANNTSTVSNNSVNGHSQTGTVSFDGQAFGNLAGLSLVSANTGNNVSINASLNLNVSIRP